MRRTVAGPVEARRGQTVRFRARLPRGTVRAYLEIYSAVGEYEPSPHIPLHKLQLTKNKPDMVNPTTMRLLEGHRNKAELTLTADEDSTFYILQDVDTAEDPLAKARISSYDGNTLFARIASSLRRLRGNARRQRRGGDADAHQS